MLRNVVVAQRRVGKGQHIVLAGHFLSPQFAEDETESERAIEIFDQRVATAGMATGADLGLIGSGLTENTGSPTAVIIWGDLRRQDFLAERARKRLSGLYDPFFPMLIDLKKLAPAAYLIPDAVSKETQAMCAVLETAWSWLHLRRKVRRNKRGSWSQYGYLLCPKLWFRWRIDRVAAGQAELAGPGGNVRSGRELMSILLDPTVGVVISVGSCYLIDVASASALLPSSFVRAQQGRDANMWGSSFEVQLQELIDLSPWRPRNEWRPLIRRKLQMEGRVLTDIDAVAEVDGALLLIDAKAFRMPAGLRRGEYGPTESLRKNVETASVSWRDKIEAIRSQPAILPVVVEPSTGIHGLVVTPFVPFVTLGPATELVLGLHRVSSVDELLRSALASTSSAEESADPSD
jgi:hypothetical protein